MRLWSLHPSYLDGKGLAALWREGLLAKKVLENETKGYRNHPQLIRFKLYENPVLAINSYLFFVYLEGKRRGFKFNKKKISVEVVLEKIIPVTKGQVEYEFLHLCKKLRRDELKLKSLMNEKVKKVNPIFFVVEGTVEEWEKPKYNA